MDSAKKDILRQLSDAIQQRIGRDECVGRNPQAARPMLPTMATGWPAVDEILQGGLMRGCLHEWFNLPATVERVEQAGQANQAGLTPCRPYLHQPSHRHWSPPLCLFSHLAMQCLRPTAEPITDEAAESGQRQAAPPTGYIVWIGKRCWPYPHVLMRTHWQTRDPSRSAGSDPLPQQPVDTTLLRQSVFIDPPNRSARLWAIDLALRNRAVAAVFADGSGFDIAATRRIQLAAQAGHCPALLARPIHEQKILSVAGTRWQVEPITEQIGEQMTPKTPSPLKPPHSVPSSLPLPSSPTPQLAPASFHQRGTIASHFLSTTAHIQQYRAVQLANHLQQIKQQRITKPRWRVRLTRCKHSAVPSEAMPSILNAIANQQSWILEWSHGAGVIDLSALLVNATGSTPVDETANTTSPPSPERIAS